MINSISKMVFLTTLFLGSILTISSSSWLGMWIGLEINLLSFIPLMIDNKNIMGSESAIKYFLIQTMASLTFLFIAIFYTMKYNINFNLMKFNYENTIIMSTMMLKLGAAPMHFWFPNIIEGLSWNNVLIMLTWQKIAPIMIISTMYINNFMNLFIIMSSIVGSIGGLNQTSLKKILTYSSINHISWMLIATMINNNLWMFYLMTYFLMNYSIIIMFKLYNFFHINQIFLYKSQFFLVKFCFLMNFLSLGGLPPFMGFFPKWMIIENLMMTKNIFLLLILMMTTLITLYFYTRLSFSAFLFNYPSFSWKILINKNNLMMKKIILLNFTMIMSFMILCMNSFFII